MFKMSNGGFTKVAASVVKRELDKIERETGKLMPADIVRRAKSTRHPLHKAFDWKDTTAAHKWRLLQATQLILNVRLIGDDGNHRVYVNVGYGQGFASISRVREDINLAEQIVAAAKNELDEWTRRYWDLREQLSMVEAAVAKIRTRKKKSA